MGFQRLIQWRSWYVGLLSNVARDSRNRYWCWSSSKGCQSRSSCTSRVACCRWATARVLASCPCLSLFCSSRIWNQQSRSPANSLGAQCLVKILELGGVTCVCSCNSHHCLLQRPFKNWSQPIAFWSSIADLHQDGCCWGNGGLRSSIVDWRPTSLVPVLLFTRRVVPSFYVPHHNTTTLGKLAEKP